MKKRVLSLILAVSMLLSLLTPAFAASEDDFELENCTEPEEYEQADSGQNSTENEYELLSADEGNAAYASSDEELPPLGMEESGWELQANELYELYTDDIILLTAPNDFSEEDPPQEYPEAQLGNNEAEIVPGEASCFLFTPEENGWYYLTSVENSPYSADIRYADGSAIESGDMLVFPGNYAVIKELEAGITYLISVASYDAGYSGSLFFALEKASLYTITLYGNGGFFHYPEEGTPVLSFYVIEGSFFLGSDFGGYRTDYSAAFNGWYEDADCSRLVVRKSALYTPEGNMTLYAGWTAGWTVTLDANGGYFDDNQEKTTYSSTVAYGEDFYPYWYIPVHTDPHLTFSGWYADADCTELAVEESQSFIPDSAITLYAGWKDALVVTLDANGGYYNENPETGTIEYPFQKGDTFWGYTGIPAHADPHMLFTGWYWDAACTDLAAGLSDSFSLDGDITLYAGWSECFVITLDANGGSFDGEPESTIKKYTLLKGTSFYGYWFTPSHDDPHTVFNGWYTDAECTELVVSMYDSCTPAGDITLYAGWGDAWIVTLDAGGGCFSSDPNDTTRSVTIAVGEHFYPNWMVPGHSDPHMLFRGWYTDANCTEPAAGPDDSYTPTGDTTLYAGWDDALVVTLDANGGRFGSDPDHTIRSVTVADGESFYSNQYVPSHSDPHMAFSGWYADADCTELVVEPDGSYTPTGDITLYAGWSEGWIITLDANGGYFSNPEDTVRLCRPSEGVAFYSGWFTLTHNDPHLAFSGWYADADCTELVVGLNDSYVPTGDITLYAGWGEGWIITLNANGGRFSSDPNDTSLSFPVAAGEYFNGYWYIPSHSDPHKVFSGWYADAACSELVVEPDGSYAPTGDITLYAGWSEGWIITLDANGGYFSNPEDTVRLCRPSEGVAFYSGWFTLTHNDPHLAFSGWYADADCTELVVGLNDGYVPTGDITLYAGWGEGWIITLNANGGCFGSDPDYTIRSVTVADGESFYSNQYVPSHSDPHLAFSGWYADADCTELVVGLNDGFVPTGDITLYAGWGNAWIITLDANGGSYGGETEITTRNYTLLDGELFYGYWSRPSHDDPRKIFSGWYADAECTELAVEEYGSFAVTEDVILYAGWDTGWVVTFDANGGYYNNSPEITTASATINQGYNIYVSGYAPSPADPQTYLTGWYADAACTELLVGPNDIYTPKGDVTLYAGWTACAEAKLGENTAEIVDGGEVFFLFTAARDGRYRFESHETFDTYGSLYDMSGQNRLAGDDDGGDGRNFRMDAQLTGGTTYRIGVRPYSTGYSGSLRFTVESDLVLTLDANGGCFGDSEETTLIFSRWKGESLSVHAPSNADPRVYFGGWYEDANCAKLVAGINESIMPQTDMTLYAGWISYPTVQLGENTVEVIGNEDNILFFTPAEDGLYRIESHDEYDTFGLLYDLYGQVLYVSDDDGGSVRNFRMEAQLTGGTTYRIGVRAYSANSVDTLHLTVQRSYALTLDANGGSFSDAPEDTTRSICLWENETLAGSEFVPRHADARLRFIGWYADAACAELVVGKNQSFKPGGDMTLYAGWSEGWTTVLDANGGRFGDDPADTMRSISGWEGESFYANWYVPTNAEPRLRFTGWYTDAECTELAAGRGGIYTPEGSGTLYAGWGEAVAITLDANGGYFDDDPACVTQTFYLWEGAFFYDGYREIHADAPKIFTGWYADAECTELVVLKYGSFMPTEDTTLYAGWSDGLMITLDANGGHFGEDTVKTYALREDEFFYGSQYVPNHTDPHTVFGGWYADAECTELVIGPYDSFTPTEDTTLYAGWSEGWAITFDANGGFYVDSQQTTETVAVLKGDSCYFDPYISHADPRKIFIGWYADAECTELVIGPYNSFTPTEDTTLYAGWGEAWVITLDPNGGRFNDEPEQTTRIITVLKGDSCYLGSYASHADPHKFFAGWYTDPDCTELAAEEYNSFTPTEDTTLYAGWTNGAIITLNANGGSFSDDLRNTILYILPGNDSYFDSRWYIPIDTDPYKTFSGWYADADCTELVVERNGKYTPTGDITLYAGWRPYPTAALGENTAEIVNGGEVSFLFTPVKDGWYRIESRDNYDSYGTLYDMYGQQIAWDDDSGSGRNFRMDVQLTAGTTYRLVMRLYGGISARLSFAIERGITLTLDANGGHFGETSEDTARQILLWSSEIFSGGAYIPNHTDPPELFNGWYADAACTEPVVGEDGSFAPEEDTTLYAGWRPYPTAALGENTAEIVNGGEVSFLFTPAEDGRYRIESHDTYDTCGTVYGLYGQQIAYNDDGGSGRNFRMDVQLTAGTAYRIGVRPYGSGYSGSLHFTILKSYTLTLDANGGSFSDNSGITAQNAYIWPGEAFNGGCSMVHTDPHLSFDGWYADAACTEPVVGRDGSFAPDGDMTLYAGWVEGWIVSFDANGGYLNGDANLTTLSSAIVKGESPRSVPSVYSADESRRFRTWALEDGTEIAPASYIPDGDVVFYAQYQSRYTMALNANGGYFDGNTANTAKNVYVWDGESFYAGTSIPVSANPLVFFDGWYADADCAEPVVERYGRFIPTGDVTLYAGWSPYPAAEFGGNTAEIVNGGEVFFLFTPAEDGLYRIESHDNYDTYGAVYDLYGQRIAYNDDGGAGSNFLMDLRMTAGTTYRVGVRSYSGTYSGSLHFSIARYFEITLNANGGYFGTGNSVTTRSCRIIAGSSFGGDEKPRSSDPRLYFSGWYADAACSTPVIGADDSFVPAGDMALYAGWSDLVPGVGNLRVEHVYSHTVCLSWAAHVSERVTAYAIYRNGEHIGNVSACSFADRGLTAGQSCRYEVIGMTESGETTGVSALSVTPKAPKVLDIYTQLVSNHITDENCRIFISAEDHGNHDPLGEEKTYGRLYLITGETRSLIGNAEIASRGDDGEVVYALDWDVQAVGDGSYSVVFVLTDVDGAADEYGETIVLDRSMPEKIVGVAALGDVQTIYLSWAIAKEAATNCYRIYRRADTEESFRLLTEIHNRNTLSYADREIEAEHVYYYYVVGVNDYELAGEASDIVGATLSEDTEVPTVTKISPVSMSYLSGTVNLSLTAEDNVSVVGAVLDYSIGDGDDWIRLAELGENQYSASLNTTTLEDGVIHVRGIAYDAAGNESTPLTNAYSIDNTGPAKVRGLSYESTDVTVTLRWDEVPDDDIRFYRVEKKNADGSYQWTTDVYTTHGANISGLSPETEYTYRVTGYDMQGNRGTPSDDITTLTGKDISAPVITRILPKPGYYSSSIPLAITAADEYNVAEIRLQTSEDALKWNDVDSVTYQTIAKNRSCSYQLPLDDCAEGFLYVRAIALDSAGNESNSGINAPYTQYIVDRTAPAAPEDVSAAGHVGYIEVSWMQGSEPDLRTYTVYRAASPDGPFAVMRSGIAATNYFDRNAASEIQYYYKVSVNDAAGNESAFSPVVSAAAVRDSEAPLIYSVYPQTESTLGSGANTVRVLAVDNQTLERVSIELSSDGENYTELKQSAGINSRDATVDCAIPVENYQDGDNVYVRFSAIDTAGNESEPLVCKYTLDLTAPTVTEAEAAFSDGEVRITWQGGDEEDLLFYRVYRKTGATGSYSPFARRQAVRGQTAYTCLDGDLAAEAITYIYKIEAVDVCGNASAYVLPAVELTDRSAPKPVLICDSTQEVGVEYVFDASTSTDNTGISSYSFDFGDGTQSQELKPIHVYYELGDYTVTLTVTDLDGNTAQISKKISVKERALVGKAVIHIVDQDGNAVPDAPVYFDLGEEEQTVRYTDEKGYASFSASVGKHPVGCIIPNNEWLPVKKDVIVVAGDETLISMTMVRHTLIEGEFEINRMTFDEIEAAGINVHDPENQNIAKIDVHLTYSDEVVNLSFNYNMLTGLPISIGDFGGNGGGNSGGGSGGGGSDDSDNKRNYVPVVLSDAMIAVLDLPVQASFLKEFFDVRLHIICNAASTFSMKDNVVTLNVPEGLSLVSANGRENDCTVRVAEIPGQSTKTISWVLRGDEAGEYDISADYSGILSEFNEQICARFEAKEPIKVYGMSAVKLIAEVNSTLFNDAFYFNLSMENVSDIDVYMPSIGILNDALSTYLETPADREEGADAPEVWNPQVRHLNTVLQNNQGFSQSIGTPTDVKTLHPGERLTEKYAVYNVVGFKNMMHLKNAIAEVAEGSGVNFEIIATDMDLFPSDHALEKLQQIKGDTEKLTDYQFVRGDYNFFYIQESLNRDTNFWGLMGEQLYGEAKAIFNFDLNYNRDETKDLTRKLVAQLLVDETMREAIDISVDTKYMKATRSMLNAISGMVSDSTGLFSQTDLEIMNEIIGDNGKIRKLASVLKEDGFDSFAERLAVTAGSMGMSVAFNSDFIKGKDNLTGLDTRDVFGEAMKEACSKVEGVFNFVESTVDAWNSAAELGRQLVTIAAAQEEAELLLNALIENTDPDTPIYAELNEIKASLGNVEAQMANQFMTKFMESAAQDAAGRVAKEAFNQLKDIYGYEFGTIYSLAKLTFGTLDYVFDWSGTVKDLHLLRVNATIGFALSRAVEKYGGYSAGTDEEAIYTLKMLKYLIKSRLFGEQCFVDIAKDKSETSQANDLKWIKDETGVEYESLDSYLDDVWTRLLTYRDTLYATYSTVLDVPAAPSVSVNYLTGATNEAFSAAYEYSFNGSDWITGSGETISVMPGTVPKSLRVRLRGTSTEPCGNTALLTIPAMPRILGDISVLYSGEDYSVKGLQAGTYEYLFTDESDAAALTGSFTTENDGDPVILQEPNDFTYLALRKPASSSGFASVIRYLMTEEERHAWIVDHGRKLVLGLGEFAVASDITEYYTTMGHTAQILDREGKETTEVGTGCVLKLDGKEYAIVIRGDVNGDGAINIIDANLIRRYAAKLIVPDELQKLAADVCQDGRVNVIDANYIRRYAAKLIEELPAVNAA